MKNFVKLIKQLYEERFSVIENKLVTEKIPIALLSYSPINQAVELVKNFRAQGFNITNLFTIDSTPAPLDLDFNVVPLSDAAQIYPQPEFVLAFEVGEYKLAKKFIGNVKALRPSMIRGQTPDKVFEIFIQHLPELLEVYDSLIDEESKKTFCGYWLGCILNQPNKVVYANTPQYICPGFLPKSGDIVIDCGAYDGGTAVRFVNMGCKVYGFEMNKENFNRAAKLAEEKNFVVENLALGYYTYEVNYNHHGQATKIDITGSETARIMTLDNYVGEKNLPRVDFIKMDVEGSELDILKGAAITITKYKPILALSAYKLDDFWTLTKFIKSLRPDYEFALRQYASTPEDLSDGFPKNIMTFFENFGLEVNSPNYEECVLFAR